MEELSSTVESWNLAADIKLLDFMQNFSKDLSEKTKVLVDKVEELTCDTAETEVRLRNTFNEFLMLANSQFIENVSDFNPIIVNFFILPPEYSACTMMMTTTRMKLKMVKMK